MDQRSLDLLRLRGWTIGESLGAGIEGTVIALDDDTVAKIWHGRTATDLDQLERFTAALDEAHFPFGTPRVLDIISEHDQLITIERRLRGQPLRVSGDGQPLVTESDIQIIGDVLDAFAGAPATPDLAALPVLSGSGAFDPEHSFPHSLLHLVRQRFTASYGLLRRAVDDIDILVPALIDRLVELQVPTPRLIHGDLIPANVLTDDGHLSAVLDFGFLTTVGDPAFDAAITASIFDMYGPNARSSEDILNRALLERFDHDPVTYDIYRGAYAVISATCFSDDGSDGHFAWCVRMLSRPEVRSAIDIDPIRIYKRI